jgi:hypothetical protein
VALDTTSLRNGVMQLREGLARHRRDIAAISEFLDEAEHLCAEL